ncbi:hypothetical protein LOC67_14490 [Stieleria sp. JC731]|uniref:hypothetical protein n=1 Tax=Pirellulaceae TaxID=2691357 RepID=UPI001E5728EF|nr:hypothetical protein [Stieleria sp. JC731]MCC9601765.1 hypothetical protein [Stieleria sp. JC731]
MSEKENLNPYAAASDVAAGNLASSKGSTSSVGWYVRLFLPFVLFPASFLFAAVLLTQIAQEQLRPTDYIRILIVDSPTAFLGVSFTYLLLRNLVFFRVLHRWPLLSVIGGFAAFYLMTPIYFAVIIPLLLHVESESLQLVAMLLAGSVSALLIELGLRFAMAWLFRLRRHQVPESE